MTDACRGAWRDESRPTAVRPDLTGRFRWFLVAWLFFVGLPADAADLEHGREVYRKWCAPCHAPGPETHPGTEALAAKYGGERPGALEERTDLTVEYTKQMVRQGVSIMPFFRQTEISDAELDALAAYLARN